MFCSVQNESEHTIVDNTTTADNHKKTHSLQILYHTILYRRSGWNRCCCFWQEGLLAVLLRWWMLLLSRHFESLVEFGSVLDSFCRFHLLFGSIAVPLQFVAAVFIEPSLTVIAIAIFVVGRRESSLTVHITGIRQKTARQSAHAMQCNAMQYNTTRKYIGRLV